MNLRIRSQNDRPILQINDHGSGAWGASGTQNRRCSGCLKLCFEQRHGLRALRFRRNQAAVLRGLCAKNRCFALACRREDVRVGVIVSTLSAADGKHDNLRTDFIHDLAGISGRAIALFPRTMVRKLQNIGLGSLRSSLDEFPAC